MLSGDFKRIINSFALWDPNQISLTNKYFFNHFNQVYQLFSEKKKPLIGQSTKIFSVKTGFEEVKKSKQNLVKKIFGDPRNFCGSVPRMS